MRSNACGCLLIELIIYYRDARLGYRGGLSSVYPAYANTENIPHIYIAHIRRST